jgi:hypothetical protein
MHEIAVFNIAWCFVEIVFLTVSLVISTLMMRKTANLASNM